MLERGSSINVIADLILPTRSRLTVSDLTCINTRSSRSVWSDCEYSQVYISSMKTERLSNHNGFLSDLLKVYLHTSLKSDRGDDSHQPTNCELNVYMACLYCGTKQYRTAAKHCVSVLQSMQSRSNVHGCIERQLLPQFDDNIERVLGIILLYQFVLNSSLNQVQQSQQAECSDVFSVDLLAYYLAAMCLKLEHNDSECHSLREFGVKYEERLQDNGKKFIADILLSYFYRAGDKQTNKTRVYSLSHNCAAILAQRKPLGQFNTNRLSVLMIQSSVEYLNSFRRVMLCDYISVCDIVPRDYQAMYAYKCGLYEECFRLSQESVDSLQHSDRNRRAQVLQVEESDLLSLLDDDLLSLISLTRLCGVFDTCIMIRENVAQLTLSLWLVAQCKVRLRHSMTSFIDILRTMQRVHDRLPERAKINRAMLAFVYRKTVLHLKCHRR